METLAHPSRRQFFLRSGAGLGALALASLMQREGRADDAAPRGALREFHTPPRAKNVIFLNMAGGPSQLDLFDPKPELRKREGQAIPQELVEGQKFAFLRGELTLLGSPYRFAKHGQSDAEFSELLPHLAGMADELAIVRSMRTEAFNHDPAQVFLNTGSTIPGRPSMGAWVTYGLGSECQNLPAFVVLNSGEGQPLGAHSWGSGFLPSVHQGVQLRNQGDPVLCVSNPDWMSRATRRRSLDTLKKLNKAESARSGDPEIETRIAAYEMAFQMQSSVPELAELSQESPATLAAYGVEGNAYARNCLLARRLVERGVRFVEVFHRDWDHHGTVVGGGIDEALPRMCREIDQASAALLRDLKQRGLLENTLVIWGGEFGRTPIRELTAESRYLGRDHHPRAFTIWMAGGGVRPGVTHGETDPFGYNVVRDPVHVHDLHATMLHLLGINHTQFTYSHQGRPFRLTDVAGQVIRPLLA